MKYAMFHLNLLKNAERRSSSPIRMRIMAPLLALLGCAAMLVWWGMLFTRLMLVRSESSSIAADVAANEKSHKEIIDMQGQVRELTLELEQLEFYSNSVRRIGAPLAKLAEVMPLRVQLTELSIKPPPPQVMVAKGPNGKQVKLFGPTTNAEPQRIVFAGRATKAPPVVALIESLRSEDFENLVVGERKINSFRIEDASASKAGNRLNIFEFEYAMPERRFAK